MRKCSDPMSAGAKAPIEHGFCLVNDIGQSKNPVHDAASIRCLAVFDIHLIKRLKLANGDAAISRQFQTGKQSACEGGATLHPKTPVRRQKV